MKEVRPASRITSVSTDWPSIMRMVARCGHEMMREDRTWNCSFLAAGPAYLGLVGPCGTKTKHRDPGLSELAALNTLALHTGAAALLAGRGIRPNECKSEPRAVSRERMIIHHDADSGSVSVHGLQFSSIFVPRDGPVAFFVMSDVVRPHAVRDKVKSSFMPHPLPTIEECVYVVGHGLLEMVGAALRASLQISCRNADSALLSVKSTLSARARPYPGYFSLDMQRTVNQRGLRKTW